MNGAILSVISLPVNVPPLLSLLHMDFLNATVCSVVLNYPSRQKTPEKNVYFSFDLEQTNKCNVI